MAGGSDRPTKIGMNSSGFDVAGGADDGRGGQPLARARRGGSAGAVAGIPDSPAHRRLCHNCIAVTLRFSSIFLIAVTFPAYAADVPWPVNGGPGNIRYSPLTQISPANVARLAAAWTFDSGDAFKDSEMQSNPIVVDGVLYATTPKMRVVALNAETGREVWNFDPNNGQPARECRELVGGGKDRFYVAGFVVSVM